MAKQLKNCSFCGRPESQVDFLSWGQGGVHICNRCAVQAAEIVKENNFKIKTTSINKEEVPKPIEIKIISRSKCLWSGQTKNTYRWPYTIITKDWCREKQTDVENWKIEHRYGWLHRYRQNFTGTYNKAKNYIPNCGRNSVSTEAGYVGEDIESILTLASGGRLRCEGSRTRHRIYREIDKIAHQRRQPQQNMM